MNQTAAFVEVLETLWRAGLDDTARSVCTDLVLDGCAVAMLGTREPGPTLLARLAQDGCVEYGTTLIGKAGLAHPTDAARINGAAMHVLEFEPMWSPANHAISTVLPALLALAEMRLRRHPSVPDSAPAPDGERLLTALALGVEAQGRLRVASEQVEPAGLVFHPPGVVGPIGSAVACGLLLGLDRQALVHAVGIAASRAGTLLANVGSMTKALHCGQAAASGLDAALLAAHGFTADADALSGPRGYCRAFFGREVPPGVLTARRPALHVVDPGPAYKLYPSQYGTHFVIAAALEARARIGDPAEIERVVITAPPMPYVDRPQPVSGLAGKFSFQYAAAVALLDGVVTIDSFSDARRFAADMKALLPRVELRSDPERQGEFRHMQVDVAALVRGGRRLAGHCDGPPGIWGRPLPVERLEAKARACLAAVLPAEYSRALFETLRGIAEYDGPALLDLLSSLAGAGAATTAGTGAGS